MEIVRVREITEDILTAFKTLLPQLAEGYEITMDLLEDVIASDNTFLFIAKENNFILGTLTLAIYTIPTGTKAWIEDVIVDTKARGKGVGEELVKTAIAYAQEKGITRIDLSSRPERVGANKLYQKLGFTIRKTNMYRHQK